MKHRCHITGAEVQHMSKGPGLFNCPVPKSCVCSSSRQFLARPNRMPVLWCGTSGRFSLLQHNGEMAAFRHVQQSRRVIFALSRNAHRPRAFDAWREEESRHKIQGKVVGVTHDRCCCTPTCTWQESGRTSYVVAGSAGRTQTRGDRSTRRRSRSP